MVLAAVAEDAPAVAVPAEAGRLFFFKKTVKYAAKNREFLVTEQNLALIGAARKRWRLKKTAMERKRNGAKQV